MIKKYNEFLNESIESQNMLSKLTRDIIKHIANTSSYTKGINGFELGNWKPLNNSLGLELIDNDFFEYLKENFNELLFKVRHNTSQSKGTYARSDGTFSRGFIFVYYNRGYFDNIIYDIKKNDNNLDSTIKYMLEDKLLSDFNDVILHELQHVYDDFISNSKYTNSKEYNKFKRLGKTSKDNFEDYVVLPHEVNADFTIAVNSLKFIDYLKTRENKKNTKKEFNEILSDFKRIMRGYDLLRDNVQKHLIKRLYLIWQDKFSEKN